MTRRMIALAGILAAAPAGGQALDLSAYTRVDLTHAFDRNTLYWPTSPTSFRLDTLSYGPTPGGYFYSAHAYSAPEHGGTHLDAPIHFSAAGATSDQLPLERLMAPAVLIDVSAQVERDRDYRLTRQDVLDWEARNGRIEPGTIVLLRTGWSRNYGDRAAYFGSSEVGSAANLHFPSYGPEAARLLVEERSVAAIGVDAASIDHGPSTDFMVHRIAAAQNVPGFENLTGLERVPPRGAVVIALPMKIAGGSGGPLRAVALVPR